MFKTHVVVIHDHIPQQRISLPNPSSFLPSRPYHSFSSSRRRDDFLASFSLLSRLFFYSRFIVFITCLLFLNCFSSSLASCVVFCLQNFISCVFFLRVCLCPWKKFSRFFVCLSPQISLFYTKKSKFFILHSFERRRRRRRRRAKPTFFSFPRCFILVVVYFDWYSFKEDKNCEEEEDNTQQKRELLLSRF